MPCYDQASWPNLTVLLLTSPTNANDQPGLDQWPMTHIIIIDWLASIIVWPNIDVTMTNDLDIIDDNDVLTGIIDPTSNVTQRIDNQH